MVYDIYISMIYDHLISLYILFYNNVMVYDHLQ